MARNKTRSGSASFRNKWRQNPCNRKVLNRRLPFLTWIRDYDLNKLFYDMLAGTTVGLTVIPQAVAYAAVAGLSLQYGLYSSFMGPFLYVVFGTVKELTIGPTAIVALMTYAYSDSGGPEIAVLLSFLTGCVELLAGLLNLGFLVELISAPVISGFCSAAALTVISTQLKALLGLKFKASGFVDICAGILSRISDVKLWDAILGVSTVVLLLFMRKLTSLKNVFGGCSCLMIRWVDKTLWFVATSRNAFAVIAGCLLAYSLELNGMRPFTLTGDIKPGLPPFELPSFSLKRTKGNVTENLDFIGVLSESGSAIGLISLIAILEHVAIAKAFAGGSKTDASQEMVALGVGNLVGAFFGSMPITASFGRSSVQSSSGVKTPMANVFTGLLVILALSFLMPTLAYIPQPVLAAVIITSVVFLIEWHEIRPMWRGRRLELLPCAATFLCCLFINIEYGILIGTAFHILLMAHVSNRSCPNTRHFPANDVTKERIVIEMDGDLHFPGVESFRQAISKALESAEGPDTVLIIDLKNVNEIDYTGLKMIDALAKELYKLRKITITFVNVSARLQTSIASIVRGGCVCFLPDALLNVEGERRVTAAPV